MLSKPLALGLVVAAGLNLSFWGSPLKAEELVQRMPSSECDSVGQKIFNGQTDFTCQETYKQFHKEVHTQVSSSEQVRKDANGQEQKALFVTIRAQSEDKSKTEGQTCTDCTTEEKVLVFDNLKDLSAIQTQILAAKSELQKKSLDKLDDQITLRQRQEKCLVDASGERLDKEDKADCLKKKEDDQIDKLADMDDEEAAKFFDKNLEAKLKKMITSSDADERARGLELLNKVKDVSFSDDVIAKADSMIQQATQFQRFNQVGQQGQQYVQGYMAEIQKKIALAGMSQGAQKEAYLNQAKQMLGQLKQNIAQTKTQAAQLLSGVNAADFASAKMVLDANLLQIDSTYQTLVNTSPDLMSLDGQLTTGSTTTGSAANVNNKTRLLRASGLPDQLLTSIPVTTGLPANTSQLAIPNAGTLGTRAVGQDRTPVILNQGQTLPQVQQIQPVPTPLINGNGVYQSTFPLGTNLINPPVIALH